jgi:hypothetical protein
MEIFLWAVYFNAMGDLIRKSSLIKKKKANEAEGVWERAENRKQGGLREMLVNFGFFWLMLALLSLWFSKTS